MPIPTATALDSDIVRRATSTEAAPITLAQRTWTTASSVQLAPARIGKVSRAGNTGGRMTHAGAGGRSSGR